jgi:release factor glutamine methyltransferase
MTSQEPWTLGRLLTWTTDYLRQHGSESAQLDAQLLLAHARHCRRIDLFTAYTEEASAELRGEFRELVRQRAEGVPVAYLTGSREFYSLEFLVTRDVLIPRPETEFVVLAMLDLLAEREATSEPPVLADVGTGSGILAVCAARHVPGAVVWATDISDAALAIAEQNCRRHNVSDRVHLVQGDLLAPLPVDVQLDLVLSNPPYVSESEYAELMRDVREQEPRDALVAGPTGTEVIARLIPAAVERLKPGGWLVVEISPMIDAAVRALLESDGRFERISTRPDLAGHARVVQAAIRP